MGRDDERGSDATTLRALACAKAMTAGVVSTTPPALRSGREEKTEENNHKPTHARR
jgi:hypothetical protein